MSKLNKNQPSRHSVDELFKKWLRHHQVTPDLRIWQHIEKQLDAEREKTKYDHWYYIILAILIPITVATILLEYDFTHIADRLHRGLNTRLDWLYADEPELYTSRLKTPSITDGTIYVLNTQHAVNPDLISQSDATLHHPANTSLPESSVDNQLTLSTLPIKANYPLMPMLPKINETEPGEGGSSTEESGVSAIQVERISGDGITLDTELLTEDALIKPITINNTLYFFEEKLNAIKGVYLGGGARLNNNWFLIKRTAVSKFADQDMEYHFEYDVAYLLSGGYNFSRKWGMETELTLARQRQTFIDKSNRKIMLEGNINLTYLQFPLLVKYKWSKVSGLTQQPVVMNFMLGPAYTRLLQANYTVNHESFDRKQVNFARNELGMMMGMEYELYLNRHFFIALGARAGISTDIRSFPYVHADRINTLNAFVGLDASLNLHLRGRKKAPTIHSE